MFLFNKKINFYQQRVNQYLSHFIHDKLIPCHLLNDAMAYGALLGGKRIRPFLVYAVGEMLGSKLETLDPLAASVESIHAYSLIHDDLPAMDNDDLRRGQQTCHVKFSEDIAILAGDALQSLAFDILSTPINGIALSTQLKMLNCLAKAAGDQGMCAGQALDLASENKQIELKELENIHHLKTGALIQVSVQLGALSKDDLITQEQKLLDTFAKNIGLAFQVQDDILNVISDTKTLGKPQGSDIALNKSTYPALLGLTQAKEKSQMFYQNALHALSQLPYNTQLLQEFSQYVVKRAF